MHLYCAKCTNIANNTVLSVCLKSPKLTDRLRNSVGSEFQSRPSGLPQSPTAKCNPLTARYNQLMMSAADSGNQSAVDWTLKYFGALFSGHRRTMTAGLYSTRSGTSSQCTVTGHEVDSTGHGRTCECLWRDELLHSAHIVECQLWTLAIRQELRYSSPHTKQRTHWPASSWRRHPRNVELVWADGASRNTSHWVWHI